MRHLIELSKTKVGPALTALLLVLTVFAASAPLGAHAQCETTQCGSTCSTACGMNCSVQGPASHVLISEVLYNTANEEEWIELHNPTDEVVVIDGWTLDDGQGEGIWSIVARHERRNYGIAPGGFVIIAQNADHFFDNHCFYPDFALVVGASYAFPVIPVVTQPFLLNNISDEVYLRDSNGVLVDAVAWDSSFRTDSGNLCRGTNEETVDPLRWPIRRNSGAYMSAIRFNPNDPGGAPTMQGSQAGGNPLQEELPSVWTHVRSRQIADSTDGSHCTPSDEGTGIAHAGPDTGGLVVFPYVGGLTVTSAPAGTGSLSLTVQGKAFLPGATVSFSGDGIHIRQTTWLSSEAIHLLIDIRASALPGSRDVTVLTPEGYGDTASGLFQITPHQVRQASRVVFSELMIDPQGGSDLDQWIELHNPTADFVILDGWTVSNGAVSLALPDPVPGQPDLIFMPGGSVVLAMDGDRFHTRYGFPPDFAIEPGSTGAWQVARTGGNFALLRQNGQVYLHDAGGVLIDAVGWGDAQPPGEDQIQYPLFFTAPTGETLLRIARHSEGSAQGGRLNERLVEAFEASGMVSDPGEGPETGGLQAIPIIYDITPTQAEQDTQGVALVVTGRNFEPTSTLSITDTGIVFQSMTVISSERIEAVIDVALTAPASLRDVVVTNPGGYQGRLPGGFRVTQPVPIIASVSPDSVFQGDSSVVLTVTGEKTHFTAGDSQILLGNGTGYAVESIQVLGPTHLEATVTFLLEASPGLKDVRVSTAAWNESATGTGMLEVRPLPRIAAVTPSSANQGASLQVTVTGLYTHFSSGVPTVGFGPDIAVTAVTVIDDTHLTAQIEVGPFAPLGHREVMVTTGAEIAGSPGPLFEVLPRPAVQTVTPARAQQSDALYVALEGINTTWAQGSSTVDFGDGITVRNLIINGPASAVAELYIALDALPGPRDVVVTTGAEVASLPAGFEVEGKPRVLSVAPNVLVQGESAVVLELVGVHTSWTGVCQVSFTDVGITLTSVTAASPTTLSATANVAEDAPTGLRDVVVTCEGETALGKDALRVVAPIYLSAVSPGRGTQGSTSIVEVLGANTGFTAGVSTVDFGEGVTVSSVQVTSRTRLLAELVIDAGAQVGARDVLVTTGAELAAGFGLFSVDPFPYIDAVSPALGVQGSIVEVSITGVNTAFDAGSFTAFGSGVVVLQTSAISATELRAEVAVSLDAEPGQRTVTVVTGAQVARGPGLFEVVERPRLLSIAPDSGETGASVTVLVSGLATRFEQGLTTLSLGPDIAITEVRVAGPTTVEADLLIGGKAAEGLRDLTVTTGGETLMLLESFTVVLRPRISRITPSTAGQGESLVVEIEGRGTRFADEEPTLSLGEGVRVENLRVSGQLRFVADIIVDLFAEPGPRDVVVGGGERHLVLEDGFNVRPTARVEGVAPEIGRRGESLMLALLGVNTSWGPGSQALFGDGITVLETNCSGATECEVEISIQEHARLGSRDVTVITGTETAFGASRFEVLARAEVLSVYPEELMQGASNVAVTITIAGARISGEPNAVYLGDDLTISGIEIDSGLRTATVFVSVAEHARVGARDVTVVTVEAGTLVLQGALRVVGRPRVVDVIPPALARGQASTLVVLGHRTSFEEGASIVDLGPGVEILSMEVLDAEQLEVEVMVDKDASLGQRDVVVTTGSEVAVGPGLVAILDSADNIDDPGSATPSGCSCTGAGGQGTSSLPALFLLGLLLTLRRGSSRHV